MGVRYFALDELDDASLNQLFLPPNGPNKYKGPKLPENVIVLSQLAKGLEIHILYIPRVWRIEISNRKTFSDMSLGKR